MMITVSHMTVKPNTVLHSSSIFPSSSNHLQSCQEAEEEEAAFSDDAEEDMEGEAEEELVNEGVPNTMEPPPVVGDAESFPATEIDSDAHLNQSPGSDVEVIENYYQPPDNQLGLEETNPAWEFNHSPPPSGVPSSGWLPALRKAAPLKAEDLDEIKTPSPASVTSGTGVLFAETLCCLRWFVSCKLKLTPLIFVRWTSRSKTFGDCQNQSRTAKDGFVLHKH